MGGKRSRGAMRGRGNGGRSKKRRVDNTNTNNSSKKTVRSSANATTHNTIRRRSKTGPEPPSLLKLTENNWSSDSDDENPLDQLRISFGKNSKTSSLSDNDDDHEEEIEDGVTDGLEDLSDEDEGSRRVDVIAGESDTLIINENENEDGVDDDDQEEESGEEVDDDDQEEGEETNEFIEDEAECEYRDPFFKRVNYLMEEKDVDRLNKKADGKELMWPHLGKLKFYSRHETPVELETGKDKSFSDLHVRKRISERWLAVNKELLDDVRMDDIFSPLQEEMFSILNNYKDFLYCNRTHTNAEEIRLVYCLHVLNHTIKSRNVVLKHNTMLSQNKDLDTDLRDQGLTRPRVLILVPFRDAAWKIINILTKLLLPQEKQQISHRKRFNQDYSNQGYEPSKIKKPDDFEATFAGNIDDHFRLGLAISRKSVRLYTEFYKSDIIIASPLGLRTVIGAEGDKQRDWDFLSSIELLIIDQVDVFLMQNWQHLMHVMDHLHLQPKQAHDVDFSRVRMCTLNGWSKYYRQTVVLSQVNVPEINALFNKQCFNFDGRVAVSSQITVETICQVTTQLPQVFHRLECKSFVEESHKRFEFFITKILPQYSDAVMSRTLIYIPCYFDFVRVRNHFRKNELNFAQICEYTSASNISRARQHMLKGTRHMLLYTERFHFYHRYKLKGIRHVIFYQLPVYPQFFSEICNMVTNKQTASSNCSIIYSKFDAQRLAGIVGENRCPHMLSSEKDTYLLVTGNG